MFLKNSAYRVGDTIRSTASTSAKQPRKPMHSLRLRLIHWYGGLLTLGLSCFALLVLVLVQGAINVNMQNAVSAETDSAAHYLTHALASQAPYWPPQLEIEKLDTYHTPGLTIEIFSMKGKTLYASDINKPLNLDNSVMPELAHGTTSIWYNANVSGDQVLVEASAIYPPATAIQPMLAMHALPMIGILLVAKSLHDANATLMLLQSVLLLTG
ncbi:MAG: hypothetical protein ACRDHZ_21765, partial [Ktedonobacteraceae bacterium]